MAKSYGTIRYHAATHQWLVECQPYCMIRLKRVFDRAAKDYGTVRLGDTEETCRELLWFMDRFPLEVSPKNRAYLYRRASDFNRKAEEFELILGGKLDPRGFELALPLRKYQAVAAELALRARGLLLADAVGLGKTAVAIGMLCDPATRPALVVTMAHLPLQWKREIEKFAPQLVTHIVRQGTPYNLRVSGRRKKDARETAFPDVLLMNYHKLRGWADTLAGVVRTVVFDEAQELRHTESQKSRAARHIASKADVRIGLSATPIHNYGGEFYNVIDVLRPDVLGSKEEFLREWCDEHVVMGRDKSTIRDPKAFGTYLRENALMLRRTRKEVGRELPPIITIPHDVDCDLAALDKVKSDATALARIILGQDAAWEERGRAARELDARMRRATGIAKAPYVAEFVRMLAESGEKLLLYGWHRSVYDIWLDRLKDLNPVMYTGTESPAAKEAARKAFVDGDARILIMSLRSGAGLDGLQRVCHIVVYGELDWSPAVHIQCTGRVARDGVDESVVAYYLIAREGSDPTVAHVLGVKRQQLEGVIDPDAELVEQLQVDEDHIKKLARAFLERCGERVKEARA